MVLSFLRGWQVAAVLLFYLIGLATATSACSEEGGTDYMCVDWSYGSQRMYLAQHKYEQRTREDSIYFGIGSFGSTTTNLVSNTPFNYT